MTLNHAGEMASDMGRLFYNSMLRSGVRDGSPDQWKNRFIDFVQEQDWSDEWRDVQATLARYQEQGG